MEKGRRQQENEEPQEKERALTGDRTTGALHLGHYLGSLENRVALQDTCDLWIVLADVQALTTHFDRPAELREHVREMALDYIAVGIDPGKATVFVQSLVPELAELTVYFSMFVTVNALRHNPTVKNEAAQSRNGRLYYGFLGYPVSQAADIAFCKATLVPVGEDQLPHVEQTRKVVRRFNELYGTVFPEPRALVGRAGRLAGLDGEGKMSKSKGNAISLRASRTEIEERVRRAVTDPARVTASDPGHPDICPIFAYRVALEPGSVGETREDCEKARIGCSACKARAIALIDKVVAPMRERRAAAPTGRVDEMLVAGTEKARRMARETMREVRDAMGLYAPPNDFKN